MLLITIYTHKPKITKKFWLHLQKLKNKYIQLVVPAATLYLCMDQIEAIGGPWTPERGGLGGLGVLGESQIVNKDTHMFLGGHLWQWAYDSLHWCLGSWRGFLCPCYPVRAICLYRANSSLASCCIWGLLGHLRVCLTHSLSSVSLHVPLIQLDSEAVVVATLVQQMWVDWGTEGGWCPGSSWHVQEQHLFHLPQG